MTNARELRLNELENVVGGLQTGKVYTVRGVKNFLGFRNDCAYKDSNIIRKYHNGDKLEYCGKGAHGYVLVSDVSDGRMGYVNGEYLR